jgi:hypothetical protein
VNSPQSKTNICFASGFTICYGALSGCCTRFSTPWTAFWDYTPIGSDPSVTVVDSGAALLVHFYVYWASSDLSLFPAATSLSLAQLVGLATTTASTNSVSPTSSSGISSSGKNIGLAIGNSGGLSAGAKGGIAIGVILGVAVLTAIVLLLLRRRKRLAGTVHGHKSTILLGPLPVQPAADIAVPSHEFDSTTALVRALPPTTDAIELPEDQSIEGEVRQLREEQARILERKS